MPGTATDNLLDEIRQAVSAMRDVPAIRTGLRLADLVDELDEGLCDGEDLPEDWRREE